ncbi:phosphotyrosine protein phosphatase [Rhodanobacter sp. 7MK24]|uniref:low molecular weight protein tyrosine phosphatase family protein n=1 Tax=Rhodanobacter sp. 7MK24 TaxID=2775922 RepID=UPI001784ECBA|nr:low molecular weight protein tyrosine phosphatase family protein [Rhodanobacter sp. 7MK24]MBD8881443.1 phosphotyrosine protein phosphatase [Rhodanobacter sp. 7MK24]
MTLRVLFVCSRNRLRSPTAEAVFAGVPGVEADSAGVASDAETVLDVAQVDWADLIVVMERRHKAVLARRFGAGLKGKRVVCLDIPDRYDYMQPELVALLEQKVGPLLAG